MEGKAESKTESRTAKKTEDEGGPISSPQPGDADASYIDPDLSLKDSAGELPDEEKEWDEARDKAREEGVKAAEEAEEKASDERRKRRAEEQKELEERAEAERARLGILTGQTSRSTATKS